MEKELKQIKKLLILFMVPFALYLLNLLKIIFIPLVFALFGALLFMPLMRWLNKKGVHNVFGILIVIAIIIGNVTGILVVE